MDSSSNSQNRRSRRSQVLLSATLQGLDAELAVNLRNLSAEGVLVEGDDLPGEGSEVTFRRKELTAAGRVVWVDGRYAGIAFGEKLDPEQVMRHVPAPRQKIQPRTWRPGFVSQQMNAEQRRLAESWVWSGSPARLGE